MGEWSEYDFALGEENWDSAPLKTIYHIVHVEQAIQILSDNKLTARPVYDESRLNKTRVHVVWMSPNDWSNGSFYGNIRFHFDWIKIVEGKTVYWVESIKYSPHAPRFIVTARDPKILAIDSHIQKYDPSSDDGPLKEVQGKWYFNQKITLELMIEENIDLEECVRADVINHHPRICRINKNSCREFHRENSEPGSELLGYIIGSDCHLIDDALTSDVGLPNDRRYHSDLMFPVMWLDGKLSKNVHFDGPIKTTKDAKRLIRAASLQLAVGQLERAKALVALINSRRLFDAALEDVIQKHFGLDGVSVLLR